MNFDDILGCRARSGFSTTSWRTRLLSRFSSSFLFPVRDEISLSLSRSRFSFSNVGASSRPCRVSFPWPVKELPASQPASSSRVLCCRESSEAERTDVRRRNFLPSRCSSLPLASLSPVRFVSHVLRGVAGETSLVFRASAFGPSVCTLELRSNDDRPTSKRARCSHGFAKIRICSAETAQSLPCVS